MNNIPLDTILEDAKRCGLELRSDPDGRTIARKNSNVLFTDTAWV